MDNCDHHDPVNNPDDNKYGGIYITPTSGIVVQVQPLASPPVFSPEETYPDGVEIIPTCRTNKEAAVTKDDMNAAINEFCVN
jgi:hypothetical protein